MRHEASEQTDGGRKAWVWMIACCLPMIAIIVLAVLGYWGSR